MSHWMDQRAHNHRHLMRRLRMHVCGFVHDVDTIINQGGAGSVGNGEFFFASGPEAVAGRLVLTCTTGGGTGVAVFSVAYTSAGSPPAVPSPTPVFAGSVRAGTSFQENGCYIFINTTTNWAVGNYVYIDLDATDNTTPWADKHWVDPQTNSPNFSGAQEWIAQGPGLGSPLSDITVGCAIYEAGGNTYNMAINGFDAYTDTSPKTSYLSQPNISPSAYIYMDLNAQDYWLTCNARRWILLTRLASGRWNAAYAGLMLPLAGEASYGYPMFIGGMADNPNFTSSTIDVKYSSFWDPGAKFSYTGYPDRGSAWLRNPAGAYQNFWNKSDGSPEPGNLDNALYDNVVWPWANGAPSNYNHRSQYPSTPTPGAAQQVARTWFYDTGESPTRLARAFLPVQSVLISNDFAGGAAQQLGFLDGVFWVTGLDNAGGNTFKLGSPEYTYLVAQDAYRATSISYAAIRMDP